MHTAARLFGHDFLGLLGNEVPDRLRLAHVTPNKATFRSRRDTLEPKNPECLPDQEGSGNWSFSF